jgi:hypothetical protein
MPNYYNPNNPNGFYGAPNYAQPNYYGANAYNQPRLNYYAFVNGIEGAKSYQVAPNQTMLLMDSDSPTIYMKSANSLGQASLRYFKMVEISESDAKGENNKNNVEYALKSDVDNINKKIEELSAKFNEIKEEKING